MVHIDRFHIYKELSNQLLRFFKLKCYDNWFYTDKPCNRKYSVTINKVNAVNCYEARKLPTFKGNRYNPVIFIRQSVKLFQQTSITE